MWIFKIGIKKDKIEGKGSNRDKKSDKSGSPAARTQHFS